MNQQYVVSICIPVYNCVEYIERMVDDLLSSKNPNYQVVISDDSSNDGTYEKLLGFHDSRLKVCRNTYGKGAQCNWRHALDNGDGCYLYLVMGRDRLRINNMNACIDVLIRCNEQNIVCIRDRKQMGILSKKEAYKHLFVLEHPTGIIFRREEYRKTKNKDKIFQSDNAYPEIQIVGNLISCYIGAIIDCKLFWNENLYIDKKKRKSNFQKETKECYFFPRQRTRQVLRLIYQMSLDIKIKDDLEELVVDKVSYLYECVSTVWKNWNEDESLTAYYNMETRKVSVLEQINNIRLAYISVDKYLSKKMNWYTPQLKVKMLYEAFRMVGIVIQRNM